MTEQLERERPATAHEDRPDPAAPEATQPLPGAPLSPAAVLALQRTAGNAATARLLRDGAAPGQQSLAVGACRRCATTCRTSRSPRPTWTLPRRRSTRSCCCAAT